MTVYLFIAAGVVALFYLGIRFGRAYVRLRGTRVITCPADQGGRGCQRRQSGRHRDAWKPELHAHELLALAGAAGLRPAMPQSDRCGADRLSRANAADRLVQRQDVRALPATGGHDRLVRAGPGASGTRRPHVAVVGGGGGTARRHPAHARARVLRLPRRRNVPPDTPRARARQPVRGRTAWTSLIPRRDDPRKRTFLRVRPSNRVNRSRG